MSKVKPEKNKERAFALLAPLAAGLYETCRQTREYYEDLDMPLEATLFESYQKAVKAQFEEAGIKMDSPTTLTP